MMLRSDSAAWCPWVHSVGSQVQAMSLHGGYAQPRHWVVVSQCEGYCGHEPYWGGWASSLGGEHDECITLSMQVFLWQIEYQWFYLLFQWTAYHQFVGHT